LYRSLNINFVPLRIQLALAPSPFGFPRAALVK
jgi:hypothetical protein